MLLEDVINYFTDLMKQEFTGRIILDFFKGRISKKIKKEITEEIEKK